jgi:isopentenyl-diphosphate delta-isomerase
LETHFVTRTTEPLVELVDPGGQAIGVCGKLAAHVAPGLLHRAFSVFLIDPEGKIVLQRRAASKYHSAGLWSNSCCGHPEPGQDGADAASRRLGQELGAEVPPGALIDAGSTTYAIRDTRSGLWEREFDHLYVAKLAAELRPNPQEVSEVTHMSLEELVRLDLAGPTFTSWLATVVTAVLPVLSEVVAAATRRADQPI